MVDGESAEEKDGLRCYSDHSDCFSKSDLTKVVTSFDKKFTALF